MGCLKNNHSDSIILTSGYNGYTNISTGHINITTLDEIILTNGKPLSKLILNILHADPMERMNFSQLMNYLKISS